MKKFLTVLLVIAVMFTFSFSSAFADVQMGLTDAQQAEYDAAVGPNGVLLSAQFEVTWKALADPWAIGSDSYPISKKVYSEFKEAALNAVKTKVYDAAKVEGATAATLAAMFDEASEIRAIFVTELGNDMAQAQFEIDYANEAGKLDAVDFTVYSTKAYDDDFTHREKAVDIINGVKAEIAAEKAKLNSDSTIGNYKDIAATVARIVGENIQEVSIGGINIGIYELNTNKAGYDKILKTENADAAEALTEAQKAALRANVAKEVAVYRSQGGKDNALVAAYIEMFDVRIEAGSVNAINYGVDAFAGTHLKSIYDEVQKLVSTAEKYKAEKDADGNLVRDPKAIDKIVWEAKKAAYIPSPHADWNGRADAEKLIIGTTVSTEAAGLDYAQKNAKARFAKAAAVEKYYPLEQTKVDTLVAELNAKVDAAKTTDAVKTVYNDYASKLTTLNTTAKKSAVDASLQTRAAYGEAKTALRDYVTAYNLTVEDAKKLDNGENVLKAVLNKFYGENGARTNAEIKSHKNEVLTLISQLPTAEAQAAAKKAAEDAIKAIPTNVTLADEAAIQAALDAVKAYQEDVYGTQPLPSFTNAVARLTALYKVDLYKKASAIDKKDKAAVKAIMAEFEAAADKDCVEIDLDNDSVYGTLKTALENIRISEKNDVLKAINAIPVNVTEADIAAVEAARKLYDAYVEEYTDYTCATWGVETAAPQLNCNAANDFAADFRNLALAEAALGLNEDPGKDVEALKLTASSTAKKGSITVKWKVKGDASSVDYYEVRRSTKANSGYGTKPYFKTTKKSYKNTKALKKGTRYYYKVRAVAVIDGVKYVSDWSNKAYRIAK